MAITQSQPNCQSNCSWRESQINHLAALVMLSAERSDVLLLLKISYYVLNVVVVQYLIPGMLAGTRDARDGTQLKLGTCSLEALVCTYIHSLSGFLCAIFAKHEFLMDIDTYYCKRFFNDQKKLQGLGFVLLVSFIWVTASFVVQDIQTRGVNAAVLTFVSNSLFIVYLPVYWLNLRQKQRKSEQTAASLEVANNDTLAIPLKPGESEDAGSKSSSEQVLRAALLIGPLWYIAQYTFNLSLAHTSVTSNTVLSSTSALFTFFLSIFLLSELFTVIKLVCILFLMAGTVVYTLADTTTSKDASKETLGGDLLVLASAFLYASYTVTLRRLLSDQVSMTLFFGLMGLVIFITFGFLLMLLWACGFYLGTLSWGTFGLVLAKGLMDNVFSDYLWAKAILLVGPTVSTAGLSLQIPFAVVVDLLFRNPAWVHRASAMILTLLGGGLIVIGFLGITLGASKESELLSDRLEEDEMPEAQEQLGSHLATLASPLPREGHLSVFSSSRNMPKYAALPTHSMESDSFNTSV